MSVKPYRPAVTDQVRVRGSDEKWVVLKAPQVGGFVVGPADGGSMRRLVSASECELWSDAPAEAPWPSSAEIEAAIGGKPRPAPRWAGQVLDELLADWRAAWDQQPEVLHGVELAASLAALVSARWVLAADPDLVAELAVDLHSDARPQAIATLAGVVLPFGLKQLQQEQQHPT